MFGEKDYQQLALIHRTVADLELGVRIEGAPTVRDPDGLALSSRNRFLDPAEREQALALSRALRAGAAAGKQGAGPGAPGRDRAAARRPTWTTWPCAASTSAPPRPPARPGCWSPPGWVRPG